MTDSRSIPQILGQRPWIRTAASRESVDGSALVLIP